MVKMKERILQGKHQASAKGHLLVNLEENQGQLKCLEELVMLVKIQTLDQSGLMRSCSNDITPRLDEALQRESTVN